MSFAEASDGSSPGGRSLGSQDSFLRPLCARGRASFRSMVSFLHPPSPLAEETAHQRVSGLPQAHAPLVRTSSTRVWPQFLGLSWRDKRVSARLCLAQCREEREGPGWCFSCCHPSIGASLLAICIGSVSPWIKSRVGAMALDARHGLALVPWSPVPSPGLSPSTACSLTAATHRPVASSGPPHRLWPFPGMGCAEIFGVFSLSSAFHSPATSPESPLAK